MATSTATTTTKKGLLPVPEGVISYSLTSPSSPNPSRFSAHETKKPTLLFIHAAVSTQSLWNDQVEYFAERGWRCLTYDHFTWGGSRPSEVDDSSGGEAYNPFVHLRLLVEGVLDGGEASGEGEGERVVLVGLSMGGGFALEAALWGGLGERVVGVVCLAGGIDVSGYRDGGGRLGVNSGEEVEMFERVEELLEKGDAEGVARMWMRIWADGPLQGEGRFERVVGREGFERMLGWNLEIAKGERERRGLQSVEYEGLKGEKAVFALGRGGWKLPVALGYGTLDETETTSFMKWCGEVIEKRWVYGGEARAFETAHMVNLERPGEVNEWIEVFLRESGR